MAAITLRADKGSPLTNAEVDANFTNLNTGKLEKASNLSDLADTATARSNLGLGNVNNTSDANKPISTATQTALNAKENTANKGAANGYAGLDAGGKVPATQLPSYVDDVLEYVNLAVFPATGEVGKIYVALDTNKVYRWSGSAYIYITSGAVDSVAGKSGVVTLVKSDVGLANVDNTSDANKPISTAQQDALNQKISRTAAMDGAMYVPTGTETGRPAETTFGLLRGNTSSLQLEWYNGSTWKDLGPIRQAGGSDGALQYKADSSGNFSGADWVYIDGGNLSITQTHQAPYSTGNNVKLFGYSLGQLGMLGVVDYAFKPYPLQPGMWCKQVAWWKPPGNATTVPGVSGMTAPTAMGTATARTVATTNTMSRSRRLGYVSGAAAANFAGNYIPVAQLTTGDGAGVGGFLYTCRFSFSDVAAVSGARAFVGLSSSVAAPTNVEPSTLINCVGIAQLSTDSTQLYLVYGGSAAQTAIPLGTSYPPKADIGATNGILYDLIICASPVTSGAITVLLKVAGSGDSGFVMDINPTTPGVTTPLHTTLLAHRAWRCTNASTSAVGLDISNIYFETNE